VRFDILTLHPEMCRAPLAESMLGRAQAQGHIEVGIHDIRTHGMGKHRVVDATPYGGGSGMVMRVDVVAAAIEAVRTPESRVLLMDPVGEVFCQGHAKAWAAEAHLVLICGHYEGVDARVREHLVDGVISMGDFVLTGGELPALAIVDAVARLVPGVLGNPESLDGESFGAGLLAPPTYTRPLEFQGWAVPEVLRSGHHGKVAAWRQSEAEAITRARRPDMLAPAGQVDKSPTKP
jgi:tRNA (guanine37-N1)-methyltransferase